MPNVEKASDHGQRARLPLDVLAAIIATLALLAVLLALTLAQWFYEFRLAQYWLPALAAAALISTAVLLARVAPRLRLVAHLREWAERMRGGNLNAKIPLQTQGELADLIEDINSLGGMLENLALEMDAQLRAQNLRLARKTQSLDILYDVASSLTQAGTLDQQLESFLNTFIELVDARAATVHLLTEDGKLRLIASRKGESASAGVDALFVTHCEQCGWNLTSGVHVVDRDFRCTRAAAHPRPQHGGEVAVVPIQYHNHALGIYTVYLDVPVSALGEDALELLTSIGQHLGLAIEKARSDHDARRLAIMEERNLLANELHDSLAQSLVSMRLQLKMLGENLFKKNWRIAQQESRDLRIAVDEAHTSLRALLANFRLKIDERGLVPAIEGLVQRFRAESGIAVFFDNNCQALNLSPQQEIQVFHIIQEALTNVRKHSHASNVRVLLHEAETGVYTLLIEDDGQGMAEPETAATPGEHIGLSIMRDRAARLPGELTIESEPGEGTRIQVTFTARPRAAASAGAAGM